MDKQLYDSFIAAVKLKIPEKGKLTAWLVDTLFIEKEAVYRRLRGEVPFTFAEVIKISQELNISLDGILSVTSNKSRPFHLKNVDYANLTEDDYEMMEEYVDFLKTSSKKYNSEVGCAANSIYQYFLNKYTHLFRFYLLKFHYQMRGNVVKPFSQISLSNRIVTINKNFNIEFEKFKYAYFIWDELLLLYFVNDLRYFANIRLITKDEIEIIKDELFQLLNRMEDLAIKGTHPNGNKVEFYVSNINFETNYTYIYTDHAKLTLLKSYSLNEMASLDENIFHNMKSWMEALRRTSVLITGSGEIQRMEFFEKQRKFVNSL